MNGPPPSTLPLLPPSAYALAWPPPRGAGILAGRPAKWTKSAQRKMARLYLYTTLPLGLIVRLVHAHSPESAPG